MKTKFILCDNEWGRKIFHLEGVFLSKLFCEYFSNSLLEIFLKETGLNFNSKVTIAGFKQNNSSEMYEIGAVSKLNLVLWIIPNYYDDIAFCWRSKTGKIIKTTDEDFDLEDLECWIEGIKPAAYWAQVATEKKAHPFHLAGLTFPLKVYAFDIDMELRFHLSNPSAFSTIQTIIADVIKNFNLKSEEVGRKNGVVHNYEFLRKEELGILKIDTGSAGINVIKEILKSLKKSKVIDLIEIDV